MATLPTCGELSAAHAARLYKEEPGPGQGFVGMRAALRGYA